MPGGGWGRRVASAALTAAIAALTLGSSGSALAAGGCPNEGLRVGRSAQLPDCRAYEQVSPVEKNGADISPLNEAVAVTGEAISYPSAGGFAGAVANSITNQYLSVRGPDGWLTKAITLPFENAGSLSAPQYTAFAPDLSHQIIDSSLVPPTPEYIYRRNPDGSFSLLNPGMPESPTQGGLRLFVGASDDFSQIYLKTYEQLTPDAPEGEFPSNEKLYYWDEGRLALASVLPDGTPSIGSAGGTRPVSTDGSRLYWHVTQSEAEMPQYLSENGTSRLVTERESDGAEASAIFLLANDDGSVAYFTSTEQLTEDASTTGTDLYRYDALARKLVDLTASAEASGGAAQGVVGTSEDGSVVYFVAEGVLAPGATAGRPNLYVDDGSGTTFIASLHPEEDAEHPGDVIDWGGARPWLASAHAQVAPDGRSLLFLSLESLVPGYETDGHIEAYLYQSGSGLTCVSCNPTGEAAHGDATLTQTKSVIALNVQEDFPVDNIDGGGAQVFFETTDALLPTDTNEKRDVYEWERAGSGSCPGPGDCLSLISTGRGSSDSYFEGASRDGEDAFILTREPLVGQDTDNNVDVYDVRVGGGLASQNPPPAPPACETSDSCRGAAAAGATASIGSTAFFGPTNEKPHQKPHHKKPRHKKPHHKKARHHKHRQHGKVKQHDRRGAK
jgi:hypothetical protein